MEEDKELLDEEFELSESAVDELMAAGDTESLKKAWKEQSAKANKFLANWQRAQADYINYKKRVEQEQSENSKISNMVLILALLPVLDDLERAFGSLPPDLTEHTWVDGIALIHRKLQTVLENHGVSQIEALGEPFDPMFHDAVIQTEGDEGKVLEELQKGYKLHDRVLRPTMVVVGTGYNK